ncbi:hypothetical protein TNCV_4598181 [Trichonephila clavipes]|nr:hypothetical protein TNCV_4598181 [Trichonephila clavipes]
MVPVRGQGVWDHCHGRCKNKNSVRGGRSTPSTFHKNVTTLILISRQLSQGNAPAVPKMSRKNKERAGTELEISFEPPRRIRRKHIFGDGSKDVQLSYEDDLRRRRIPT